MDLTLNSYDVKELYIKIVLFEYVNHSKDDWLPQGSTWSQLCPDVCLIVKDMGPL